MIESPRYLVAKYISDLQRMEPRNIGVIVCSAGVTLARFLGENPKKPGQIDGRRVPSFVTSLTAYKQWVEFWRGELSQRKGSSKRSPQQWLDTLKQTSRGNFLLAEGGVVLDTAAAKDVPELVDDLFHLLIESALHEETRDPALDQVVDSIIRELRLRENQNFHSKYAVLCRVGPNVKERFEFSHAYANGSLQRLYQRVPLARKRAPLRRTIHDSAWMFEKVIQEGIIQREHAIALVFATDEQKSDPEISRALDVLGSVAQVANLANQAETMRVFIVE